MSSVSETLNVKNFLEQQFIVTSSEWIEACIEFVKQENSQNLSLQNLKNFVYQQWLTADLEEIGASSLPLELPTTQKTTLHGCFVLQVDGIRDVGRPAYTQLKELERDVNSNAEFSAAPEATVPSWEAKPTRMLMLNLTDGCSHIQGMEYKSISSLSPNLPPGVKVLIQGPVDCRFGVLMLSTEKIRVLGGEVENKLIQFSRKTILRELLQLPTGDETGTDSADTLPNSVVPTDTTIPISNSFQPSSTASSSRSHNSTQQIVTNSFTSRQYDAPSSENQNEHQRMGIQNRNASHNSHTFQQNFNPSAQRTNSFPRHQNAFPSRNQNIENADNLDAFETEEDDFVQSLDYGVLDEIEKETLNKSESFEVHEEAQDIWLEDEDIVQDLMAFQDEHPGFQMPFEDCDTETHHNEYSSASGIQMNKPFSYLSSVLKKPSADCTITIKGFIITVLSKLECTVDKGWSLMVKINDGTASLDVNIHDKVIEGIIGISAPAMVKMQQQASDNPEKRREVMQAISKFKVTLQDYNCLMDVKFTAGSTPCLINCHPLNQLHTQQLLERVKSYS